MLTLSACSDGGSSTGTAPSGSTTLPASDTVLLDPVTGAQLPTGHGIGTGASPNTRATVSDAEYNQNPIFDEVGVYKALQWNITGTGVKIAVLDSGVDSDHADLASNLDVTSSGSAVGSTTIGSGFEDSGNHGTRVSGIALANNDGNGMQGVAPDAQLVAIKVTDGGSLSEANQIRGMDMARDAGADIVNISFGLDGFETDDLQDAVNNGAVSQDLIDAYKRGINDDMIFTLAAGNSGEAHPEWDGKMAAYGVSAGHMLVVGSLNSVGDDIASFSNRAGDAKNYFILAPGDGVTLTDSDGGYETGRGTSFAAPFVAGAAALVKSAGPPTLSGKDIVDILLSTTDDLGDPGNDAKYGAGRLNIERALSPVGSPAVATSSSVAGPTVSLSSLTVSNTGLIGANVSQASSLRNLMFFDSYNRSYTTDISSSATTESSVSSVASQWLNAKSYLNQMNIGERGQLAISYNQTETGASANLDKTQLSLTTKINEQVKTKIIIGNNWASSYAQAGFDGFEDLRKKSLLNLTNQGVGAQVSSDISEKTRLSLRAGVGQNSETEFDGRQALALIGVEQKLNDKTKFLVDVGISSEKNQIMGTELGLGFQSTDSVDTGFVSLAMQHRLKQNLNIGMNYSFGKSGSFAGQGLIKQFAGGRLDSAEIWLGYEGKNQAFKAGLSRELGYRSGSLLLSVPQSVTYEGDVGTVHFNNQNVKLKSSTVYGASLSYARKLGKFGSLELMGKLKASHTSKGSTGFDDTSVDAGIKYKLAF